MSRKILAAIFSLAVLALGSTPAAAQARKVSETSVGSWTVIGWSGDNGSNYCSAERTAGGVTVAFARVQGGYLVLLRSPQITLTGDGAHPIVYRVDGVTFGRASAKLLGPNLIAFLVTADPGLMKRVAAAPVLKIKIGETVMSFSLDGAEAALPELDNCFSQRSKAAKQEPQQPSAPAQPGKIPPGVFEAPKARLS